MKYSYAVKIWISISLLSVSMTLCCVSYLYLQSRSLLLHQMGSRLADVGRTAIVQFSDAEYAALQRLTEQAQRSSAPYDLVIQGMKAGDYRESIDSTVARQIMESDDFQLLVRFLRRIKASTESSLVGQLRETQRPAIRYATILVRIPEDSSNRILRFLADADYDDSELPNPFGTLLFSNSEALQWAVSGSVAADDHFRYENGQYLLSAGIPIRDTQGKPIAILALDYDAGSEANTVKRLKYWSGAAVVVSFLLSSLIAVLISRMLNRPIELLRMGAQRVRDKDFTTRVAVTSNDELGLLGAVFNEMVDEIGRYSQHLEAINRSLERFVPKEFLKQLGHERITDVRLGDHVQRQMTVLFSDIRSFSTITEYMSPRDSFDFVNEYLRAVSPAIRRHGGFIDKFIGDAIMALFPSGPESAVSAAIDMQRALAEFNRSGAEVGRAAVRIGIGIHHGSMMLGTVGESERMEGTVIADAVNLASRLESLTKEYHTEIIVSEFVANSITQNEDVFSRYLGTVQVKGKQLPTEIYELIPNRNCDATRIRIVSRHDFDRAVRALEERNIGEALAILANLLDRDPSDATAQYFIERCRGFETEHQQNL